MHVFQIIAEYYEGLLRGVGVTLKLCLVIWTVGLGLGTALGVLSTRWPAKVGTPMRVLAFVLSGLPVLVLLFWMHYPAQSILNVVVDPFYTAAATLAIVNIFAVAGVVRDILVEFPGEYLLAARVCGLNGRSTFRRVQFPIVLRQALPPLLLLQVNMLHMTLFASLISVDEIFRVTQRINSAVYRPVEIYTALGLFFLAICLPLNGLALWMRSRFTRNVSEQ